MEKSITELNELQLQDKIKELREKRLVECMSKIEQVLKEYNCTIVTDLDIVIDGKKVSPIIISL